MIEGKKRIIFRRRIGSLWKVENCIDYSNSVVVLEMHASKDIYQFDFIDEFGNTVIAGSGEVHYLSTEAGGRFTGNYIVLYATGNGSECTNTAYFDWFDYSLNA
jgi:alpha-N-arabinofuranosidase